MRVIELAAYHIRVPLKKPIRHASCRRTESDNVVARCRLDSGHQGFGEGVPREYVTGETVEHSLQLLKRSPLNRLAVDCTSFAAALELIEQFQLAPVEGDVRDCQGNATRCALELALLDAFGQGFTKPLSEVTRLLAPNLYQPLERVQYSGAITSATGFKARAAAWMMRLYGFKHLKVKVGIAGQDDVRRLRIIRRRVGRGMSIRIDANEAWKPAEVVNRIRELVPYGIASMEQPVAHEDVDCLAEVRRQVTTPIMLDESLCSLADARRAAEKQTCDLFNIRLSKCGGFIRSLRLAQLARQQSVSGYPEAIGYQLGCQVGESAILSAAGRHFACSVRDIPWLEGSYDRRLLRANLSKEDLTFGYGGWAPALKGPGLGVQVDEEALERMTVRKEVLLG
jgi:L-alanine-DL-glutamate epimerase-like enolase superfamily enzyme